MMKSLCTLARRPGLSRSAFQAHYEGNHAPLACRWFPFAAYARNHLIDAPGIGFDTISEFWAEDMAAILAVNQGQAGSIMRADEARFMDMTRVGPGGAEEHRLSDGPVADGEGRRLAALVRWSAPDAQIWPALLGWARRVAASRPGVSLDRVTPWETPGFPAQAVLWAPPGDLGNPPATLSVATVLVRHCPTPPRDLIAGRAAGREEQPA